MILSALARGGLGLVSPNDDLLARAVFVLPVFLLDGGRLGDF